MVGVDNLHVKFVVRGPPELGNTATTTALQKRVNCMGFILVGNEELVNGVNEKKRTRLSAIPEDLSLVTEVQFT